MGIIDRIDSTDDGAHAATEEGFRSHITLVRKNLGCSLSPTKIFALTLTL